MSTKPRRPPNPVARRIFASIFLVAGVSHFAILDLFVKVMPPYLPHPRELVWISGAIEIALGILLLIPRTGRLAAWGLVALLIAVFPANVNVFLHWDQFPPREALPAAVPPALVWLGHLVRLPMQGLLIYWAYLYTRPPHQGDRGTTQQES